MSDIELVIKIDEQYIKQIDKIRFLNGGIEDKSLQINVINAIKNGTPLPKGHGRIGDLDKLIRAMKERNNDNGGEPLNAVDRGYDLAFQHMIKESKECVIIEADKEQEDGNVYL